MQKRKTFFIVILAILFIACFIFSYFNIKSNDTSDLTYGPTYEATFMCNVIKVNDNGTLIVRPDNFTDCPNAGGSRHAPFDNDIMVEAEEIKQVRCDSDYYITETIDKNYKPKIGDKIQFYMFDNNEKNKANLTVDGYNYYYCYEGVTYIMNNNISSLSEP